MRGRATVMPSYWPAGGIVAVLADPDGSTPQRRATTLHPLVAVHFTGPVRQHGLTRVVMGSATAGGTAVSFRPGHHRAVAQLARVPVSKTGGWGFESLLPCAHGSRLAGVRRQRGTRPA